MSEELDKNMHQWHQNGDHPEDESVLLLVDDARFLSEGKVVRYFRDPWISGDKLCDKCGKYMHYHGWIDDRRQQGKPENPDGIVCPGDWIVKDSQGNYSAIKFDIMQENARLKVENERLHTALGKSNESNCNLSFDLEAADQLLTNSNYENEELQAQLDAAQLQLQQAREVLSDIWNEIEVGIKITCLDSGVREDLTVLQEQINGALSTIPNPSKAAAILAVVKDAGELLKVLQCLDQRGHTEATWWMAKQIMTQAERNLNTLQALDQPAAQEGGQG